jgi:3D (Asp-Asp-Asp) domain-containing protein
MLGICAFLIVALSVDSRLARSAAVSGAALSRPAPSARPAAAPAVKPPALELMHDVTASPDPEAAITTLAADVASSPHVRTIWMEVTAYCGCKKCCGPRACGITASGRSTVYNSGLFVAADTSLFPFGTQFKIPEYAGGEPVEVIDRGSAIKGYHLDVYFSDHDQARAWGRRWIAVAIVE